MSSSFPPIPGGRGRGGGYTVLSPSGDQTGTADAAALAAAIAAAPAVGGVIRMNSSAPWYVRGGQVSTAGHPGVYIDATGCTIYGTGSGDIFRFSDTSTYSTRTVNGGGFIGYPVIDGTLTTGAAAAVHAGDIFQLRMEAWAQNFAQAGSYGFHFDNQAYWTEQLYARLYAQNCATHVAFDVSGATTSTSSYARADLGIYIDQVNPAYNGVVVQNGADIYDANLKIRGNFGGGGSAVTSAVLTVTGAVPAGHGGAGNLSSIGQSQLDIQAECAAGAFNPTTIVVGSAGNSIVNCYGLMDFNTGFSLAAGSAISAIYPFNGYIQGDSGLATASGYPAAYRWSIPGGIAVGNFAGAAALATGGTISTAGTGLAKVTTAAAVTGVILQAGGVDGQQVAVTNETGFTITFAAAGTSHVADGVSDVIAALRGASFIWDSNAGLWFRAA